MQPCMFSLFFRSLCVVVVVVVMEWGGGLSRTVALASLIHVSASGAVVRFCATPTLEAAATFACV